jgi:hypothetical protein
VLLPSASSESVHDLAIQMTVSVGIIRLGNRVWKESLPNGSGFPVRPERFRRPAIVLLLIVLPCAFIRFFHVPWLEAHLRLRAPRELAAGADSVLSYSSIGVTSLLSLVQGRDLVLVGGTWISTSSSRLLRGWAERWASPASPRRSSATW